MDVCCPACAAKYTCDEEKLRGKTARMRCKACNTAWMVSGPGATSSPSMPPPGSSIFPPPASMSPSSPPRSMPPPSMTPSIPAPQSIVPTAEAGGAAKRVKKNEERENRDLFAARDPEQDQGSVKVKDTLLPPPSFGFTTGSRNESSVLFRVDQLSDVGGRIKTPDPIFAPTSHQPVAQASEPRFGGDEEGVIDLKALASAPPGIGAGPLGRRAPVIVAPLFSEPPPMLDANGFSSGSQPAINKPISKGKLFGAIAAAAVFLVVAGFGISLAFKGEEPVHHAAAIAPPPAPSPTVTASAPPVDPAPASSSASNEETTSAKGKKAGKKGGKKTSGGGAQASTEKKPPKAADPCGCKGDFNCILACTAKNGK